MDTKEIRTAFITMKVIIMPNEVVKLTNKHRCLRLSS